VNSLWKAWKQLRNSLGTACEQPVISCLNTVGRGLCVGFYLGTERRLQEAVTSFASSGHSHPSGFSFLRLYGPVSGFFHWFGFRLCISC
jgi:hypothetical protein